MIRLNANLSMLFTEHAFLERFGAAASAGFRGVEYLFPYDFAIDDIRQRLDDHGLRQVLFNLPAGDWVNGDRGIACDPARIGEFRESIDKAIEYAQGLGCEQCNVLAGIRPADCDEHLAHETFVANLHHAATRFGEAGLRLMVEAINTRDIPGFFLNRSAQAIRILDEVGCDNLFFQYDIYHMQVMEGNLAETIANLLPRIGHMQLADNPGRHEPGTGEINYRFLFDHIDRLGYQGWIGCEYVPAITTDEGLGWMRLHGVA
jgi:hydroxypyruvate isomerase